jgi:hypothetical protein
MYGNGGWFRGGGDDGIWVLVVVGFWEGFEGGFILLSLLMFVVVVDGGVLSLLH